MIITLQELRAEIQDCTGNTKSSMFLRFQHDPEAVRIEDRAAKSIVDQADYRTEHAYASAVDHLFDTGKYRLYFVLRDSLLMHTLAKFYSPKAQNIYSVQEEIQHRFPGFVSHLVGYKPEGFFFAASPRNPLAVLIPRNQQRQFLRKINPLSLDGVQSHVILNARQSCNIGYLLERASTLLHALGKQYSVNDPHLKKYFIASDRARKLGHQYIATHKLLTIEQARINHLINSLKPKQFY